MRLTLQAGFVKSACKVTAAICNYVGENALFYCIQPPLHLFVPFCLVNCHPMSCETSQS